MLGSQHPPFDKKHTQMTQSSSADSNTMEDTIAAIATGIGPCGIGIIRISGSEAIAVAGRIFKSPSKLSPSQFASHTVHHGLLVQPETGEEIDDALLTVFKGPSSYTGEDVVEISCHGGSVTLRKALDAVFSSGARPAEPGEFTKRAFLNGRLDLVQAEAVNDIIRAQTDQAQKLAIRQLDGELSREVSGIAESILSVLSRIEASVDFPEDVDEPDCLELASETEEMISKLDELISTSDRGRIYREGISLAIVGRPNVGKSSLLNALLRQSRAIVTPVPGTTRDVIEETININGIPVVAADTAGLREASDEVERIGVELAEKTMAAAGIVIVVLDVSSAIPKEDLEIVKRAGDHTIVALNKMDLLPIEEAGEVIQKTEEQLGDVASAPISAANGTGILELEDKIAELALGGKVETGESECVTNLRHKQAMVSARESLKSALETMRKGLPIDLLSVDFVGARMSLGEITGETASEDLIDRIFADFCIGK
jgi:tRNA modification GTPase